MILITILLLRGNRATEKFVGVMTRRNGISWLT